MTVFKANFADLLQAEMTRRWDRYVRYLESYNEEPRDERPMTFAEWQQHAAEEIERAQRRGE